MAILNNFKKEIEMFGDFSRERETLEAIQNLV